MPRSRPACWPPKPPSTRLQAGRAHDELTAYPEAFEKSWLYTELNKSRNFKAWFKKGLNVATVMNGIEQFVLRGHIPWTLRRDKPDHLYLKPAAECKPIVYPKPDGKITFDRSPACSSATPTMKSNNRPT
jgi:electron-transferring-flavoprotein dehydrogenase